MGVVGSGASSSMSRNQPLVSIVTPSFNQAQFLEEAILSVIHQAYPRIEYIVIDGGSTDGSLEIIERYASKLAYWASARDSGQADAINRGMDRSTGEIVAWLNSDDLYLAGAIRQAVDALQAHPEAAMVFADGLMVDETGRLLDRHRYRSLSTLDLLCFDVLLQPTVFMRKEVLEEVGFLDASYNLILDHDLWVRLSSSHPIVHIPRFWAVERTHAGAKTIAQASAFVEEAQRMIARVGDSKDLGPLVRAHRRQIGASLDLFAAKRLIDAGDYRLALERYRAAARQSPVRALRFWYKAVQAAMGVMGLDGIFLAYRKARRRVETRGARITMGPSGAELAQAP